MLENKDYLEIENLLPSSYADHLQQLILNQRLWQYNDSASGVDDSYDENDKNIVDYPQMVLPIYDPYNNILENEVFAEVKPVFWFLEEKTKFRTYFVDRIKSNLLWKIPSNGTEYAPPHVDNSDPKMYSMVYYLNDSDGDTVLFDKKVEQGFYDLNILHRSKPKKNKAIIFNSNRFHASSNPRETKIRNIINFVFKGHNVTDE